MAAEAEEAMVDSLDSNIGVPAVSANPGPSDLRHHDKAAWPEVGTTKNTANVGSRDLRSVTNSSEPKVGDVRFWVLPKQSLM